MLLLDPNLHDDDKASNFALRENNSFDLEDDISNTHDTHLN
jgi:hypothetical protein